MRRSHTTQTEVKAPLYTNPSLNGTNLSYKRPKLHVKSDDPNYYRKKREVRSYQRIAPALEKKGF